MNTKASLDVSTKQDVISKAGLNLKFPALPLKIKAQGSAHHRGGGQQCHEEEERLEKQHLS